MMKRIYLYFFATCCFTVARAQNLTAKRSLGNPEVTIGANVVHPLNWSLAEQNATLSEIKSAGVSVIRIGFFAPDADKGIAFIKRAYAQNIRVLLIIHSQYAPNAPIRPYQPKEFPGMWHGAPLSYADTELSRLYFQQLMDKLDTNGIVLAGLELENEINHPAFNAEFPLPGEGKNFDLDDLYHDPEGQQIAKGYLQYLKVLTVLKQIRDHSKLNQYTPLISAGLSDTGPEGPWPQPKKYDAVSISATIRFLRANGLDKLVDAYGIHVYPWADSPGDKAAAVHRLRRLMQTALPECYPIGSSAGKPCWITEWGFTNASTACPSDEKARSLLVQEMMNDFRPLVQEKRLLGLIYYSWTGDRVRDVYRCGALTETGKIALQPF
ncbi:hypothetical protein HDF18_05135 [Mucilaginibacter sp. X5P1]|uniref:hypothetical protein n=1 Tax=Mucilaginibacter sp. X5P1 TaxID=2723088 RepID=UPI003AFFF322